MLETGNLTHSQLSFLQWRGFFSYFTSAVHLYVDIEEFGVELHTRDWCGRHERIKPMKMHKCAILSQHGDEIFTRDRERWMTQKHASTFNETLVLLRG